MLYRPEKVEVKGRHANFGLLTGNCAHKSHMVPGDPEIRSNAPHMTGILLWDIIVSMVMQAEAQFILMIQEHLDRKIQCDSQSNYKQSVSKPLGFDWCASRLCFRLFIKQYGVAHRLVRKTVRYHQWAIKKNECGNMVRLKYWIQIEAWHLSCTKSGQWLICWINIRFSNLNDTISILIV